MKNQEEFEDTKRVIQIRKSKTDRQHNGQKSTKGQITTYIKTKDRLTRTLLKTGDELMCSGRVSSSCSTKFWNMLSSYLRIMQSFFK